MPATALITKLAHADPPRDCQAKQGCTTMAYFAVVVREGGAHQFKYLCQDHTAIVEKMAKAGTLSLAPTAADRLRVPMAPPPLAPPLVPLTRPRITFEIPKEPLVARCKSCPAAIVWINHPRTKALMPINANGDRRGESHFATCPNANSHRKSPR